MKIVYAVMIFFIGFTLGYTINASFDNSIYSENELSYAVEKDNHHTTKSQNAWLSSPSDKINTEANKQEVFIENKVASSVKQTVRVHNEDTNIESKLANIGFLISDNEADQLAQYLSDDSPLVRQHAIIGLGDLNSDDALMTIGQVLFSDPELDNRIVAINVLERNLHIEFISYFLTYAMQNDAEYLVREAAAKALGMEADALSY